MELLPPDDAACRAAAPVLVRVDRPRVAHPGLPHLAELRFSVTPGLTVLRGGDGRGKTTLLRLLAGELEPDAGTVERRVAQHELYGCDLQDARHDAVVLRDWLAVRRDGFPAWNDRLASDLVEAFALSGHLDKRLNMVSAGTRRKVGLVAAFACGAPLTLLDTPAAALDAPSCELLDELLTQAAEQRLRAFVVADHTVPAAVAPADLAGLVELGD